MCRIKNEFLTNLCTLCLWSNKYCFEVHLWIMVLLCLILHIIIYMYIYIYKVDTSVICSCRSSISVRTIVWIHVYYHFPLSALVWNGKMLSVLLIRSVSRTGRLRAVAFNIWNHHSDISQIHPTFWFKIYFYNPNSEYGKLCHNIDNPNYLTVISSLSMAFLLSSSNIITKTNSSLLYC
jgi:hypothetical protein